MIDGPRRMIAPVLSSTDRHQAADHRRTARLTPRSMTTLRPIKITDDGSGTAEIVGFRNTFADGE
jgi:hypothetical protein